MHPDLDFQRVAVRLRGIEPARRRAADGARREWNDLLVESVYIWTLGSKQQCRTNGDEAPAADVPDPAHEPASPALWWTPPAGRLMILRIGESVETQESD
jgi:hypothetical protein